MRFPQAIAEFVTWTQQPEQHGATWKVVGAFEPARGGWRVKWSCNDRVCEMDATDGRKLARYFRQQFAVTFRNTPAEKRDPAKEVQVFAWIEKLDATAKACLLNKRQGLIPPPAGKTAEQMIEEATRPAVKA